MIATAPSTAVLALQRGYKTGDYLLEKNLEGITEERAASRSRPDMNNILWLVGHVAYWRHEAANELGVARNDELPDLSRFKGVVWGTPADTTGWSLRDVVQLAGAGMARLTESFATNTIARGDIAAIERLTVLLIHEGYTLGQIAELRRLMGLEGAIGRQPAT